MTAIPITITEQEMMWGAMVGTARHAEAVGRGRKDRHGFDPTESGLGLHIEGACGEIAVAKWRGIYFGGTINSFKGADIGAHVQVKTRSKHHYELLVRPDDNDAHCFVLVTGVAPFFLIHGWMWGRDAKQPRYLKEHGGRPSAFFVPQSDLRPLTRRAGP